MNKIKEWINKDRIITGILIWVVIWLIFNIFTKEVLFTVPLILGLTLISYRLANINLRHTYIILFIVSLLQIIDSVLSGGKIGDILISSSFVIIIGIVSLIRWIHLTYIKKEKTLMFSDMELSEKILTYSVIVSIITLSYINDRSIPNIDELLKLTTILSSWLPLILNMLMIINNRVFNVLLAMYQLVFCRSLLYLLEVSESLKFIHINYIIFSIFLLIIIFINYKSSKKKEEVKNEKRSK